MIEATESDTKIVWTPQPGPQTALIQCPVFEVFFGGSRGGGKTDGVLGDWTAHASEYGQYASGLMVRRKRTELVDTIERSKMLYTPLGAKYHEQDKLFRFPDGARLRFAYLENDSDADNYQGHAYTRVYVEEIGNFPRPQPIMKLMATLRSSNGVPVGFRATGNPGGIGHAWVKERYINPSPAGWKIITSEFKNPFTDETVTRDRVYIPSRLSDNKILMESDPGYVANLQMLGSPELVRAWLEGDWDVVAGAAFEKLTRNKHMIRTFEIPEYWTKFTCMDWGTAKPYSIGWYTVVDDTLELKAKGDWPTRLIAKGSIIRYRELYGYGGQPDVGTREESWEVARKMVALEDENIDYRIADSAMWAEHDGPSAAENFMKELARLKADKKTTNPTSMEKSRKDRVANYLELRNRIAAIEGEQSGLYIWPTCEHFWRTVPDLQLDERDPEKGWDTDQEDHVIDECGYAIVSRPKLWTFKERDLVAYDKARKKAFEADRKGNTGRYS
jgi:hypothetical protein